MSERHTTVKTTVKSKPVRLIKATSFCTTHNTKPVPWVQLKGKWLRQAGFEINTPVKIRVMDKCLVLTAEG